MTDLEITRLCAEAMGPESHSEDRISWRTIGRWIERNWNPLTDDAQVMALLFWLLSCGKHVVIENNERGTRPILVIGKTVYPIHAAELLRRAVCECVAKIQRGKNV